MICGACGTNNSSGVCQCVNCGGTLAASCPACASEVPDKARFCPGCGCALVPSAAGGRSLNETDAGRLSGERKQVTILFGDFHGFTAFSAGLDPEDLRDTMENIWTGLDAIIVAHGGTPEKHSGDALMAVFGGHKSREEDPVEAVRAALAMQEWLKNRESTPGQPPLQMRIGIHTGLAVVGPAEATGEFLATGDCVNLASRLEQNAPVGGVLISRETYRHVFGFFDAQAVPLLTVKGIAEPVETYCILRAKARGLASQMRGIQGVETEMIGRQSELARLLDTFRCVIRDRSTRFTAVVGEAGIGKSRLLFEFQKKAELFPEYYRIFLGRATAETASLPFALIRDLFSARFEIQESDPAAVAREKFERGLIGLLGTGSATPASLDGQLLQDIHFLGQLLGLDFSVSPDLRNVLEDAEQIRRRAFTGFSRLIAGISHCPAVGNEPKIDAVLLILEDLHGCDQGSLELLEHLIRHSQDLPLMILSSARPELFEDHPGWCHHLPNVVRLSLDALSVSESNTLVGTLLRRAREIPTALKELVTEGAEGNPFYVEELIKMLMDQRVILPQDDHWQIELGRLARTRIPSTLTGILQARLDGLSHAERRVLQRASVVGRVFWDDALGQMDWPHTTNRAAGSSPEGAVSQPELRQALEDLCHKELIYRRESSAFAGSAEYHFKHELLRNVTFESLLKKSRRHYHARFAGWLQEQAGDRILEFAPLLASHFEMAARPAEAAEWHGRAGQQARLGYSPATAILHFQKALELLAASGLEENKRRKLQLEWQEGLVDTLGAQARYPEALEACRVLLKLARQSSDVTAESWAWNGMAYLYERQADNRASVECAEQAETLAAKAGEAGRAELIKALLLKCWAFYRLGDDSAVLDLGGNLFKLCGELGDHRGQATSFKLLGVAHLQLGHYREADRFFEQGLALFLELGDQRNTAAMWSNRGETARARGDYLQAVGLYEKALSIVRQIGQRDSELIYLSNVSGARLGIGQCEQAEADLHQVISQTTAPNSCTLAEAHVFLSEALLAQGKPNDAARTGQKALQLALESQNPLFLGEAWRALGRIGAAMSRQLPPAACDEAGRDITTTDPAHCFAESLRVFRQINAAGEQARTVRAWAEYDLKQGLLDSARQKLREARDVFLCLDAPLEVAATDLILQDQGGEENSAATSSGL